MRRLRLSSLDDRDEQVPNPCSGRKMPYFFFPPRLAVTLTSVGVGWPVRQRNLSRGVSEKPPEMKNLEEGGKPAAAATDTKGLAG